MCARLPHRPLLSLVALLLGCTSSLPDLSADAAPPRTTDSTISDGPLDLGARDARTAEPDAQDARSRDVRAPDANAHDGPQMRADVALDGQVERDAVADARASKDVAADVPKPGKDGVADQDLGVPDAAQDAARPKDAARDAARDAAPDLPPDEPDATPDVAPPPDAAPDAGGPGVVCQDLPCFASGNRRGRAPCVDEPLAACGVQLWALCDCNAGGAVHLAVEAQPGEGPLRRVTVSGRDLPGLSLAIDERCLGPPQAVCDVRRPCLGQQHHEWRVPFEAGGPGEHRLVLRSGDVDGRCVDNDATFVEVAIVGGW